MISWLGGSILIVVGIVSISLFLRLLYANREKDALIAAGIGVILFFVLLITFGVRGDRDNCEYLGSKALTAADTLMIATEIYPCRKIFYGDR